MRYDNENRQQTGVPGKPFRYTNIRGLSSQNNFLTWATAIVQRMFKPDLVEDEPS